MALRLAIENETSLPDGGPLSVTVSGRRGLDIGRDQHLDWTLPDPTRTVSGKHCEVRFHDDAYWLHDVSTNGTYLNGSDRRLQAPHRLRNGDRIEIGHYIIAVSVDGAEAHEADSGAAAGRARSGGGEFWGPAGEAAPPIPRNDLRPPRETRPVRPDFLDWAVDAPAPSFDAPFPSPPEPRHEDMAWASGPKPVPVVPAPPPQVPTPRRPAAAPPTSADPWDDPGPFASTPGPDGRLADPASPAAVPPSADFAVPVLPPGGEGADLFRRFAKGAGISEDVIAWRDPGEFSELLGALMRVVAADLQKLLAARAESKRLTRSSDQTTVQALDNNPLKFSPSAEDALRIMFGRPTGGYLDARRALEECFKDLKVHQVKTYAAMQAALRLLVEDLDPQAIEESAASDKGLGALVGSRKAKLWDTYVARWNARTAPHEHGFVDAFMLYFAECYDRGGGKGR
jgi:type VI secretion system protein ImpI